MPASCADGLWEAITRPFTYAFNTRPIQDYDYFGPDFLLGYLAAIVCVGTVIAMAARRRSTPNDRHLLLIGVGFLATFAAWTFLFSIQRYAMALWLLSPSMAFAVVVYFKPTLFQTVRPRLALMLRPRCNRLHDQHRVAAPDTMAVGF